MKRKPQVCYRTCGFSYTQYYELTFKQMAESLMNDLVARYAQRYFMTRLVTKR